MIYLAGPYSHIDHQVVAWRAHQHSVFLVECDRAGRDVYSPITQWHSVTRGRGLLDTPEEWRRRSLFMLRLASELWILKLPGWEISEGTKIEIIEARRLGIIIRTFDPVNYRDSI